VAAVSLGFSKPFVLGKRKNSELANITAVPLTLRKAGL
jgi:hypothetical protein